MATKKGGTPPKKKSSAKKPKAGASAKGGPADTAGVDGSARLLVSASVIKDAARLLNQCKEASQRASGDLGSGLRGYKEKGLNLVAFNLAMRFVRMTHRDPVNAAINYEDFKHCLEVLEFEKKIAPSMFKAAEVRSAKGAKRGKKNGADGKQGELPTGDAEPEGDEETGSDLAAAGAASSEEGAPATIN